MFYLKRVEALLEEENARAGLEGLGDRLGKQGIAFHAVLLRNALRKGEKGFSEKNPDQIAGKAALKEFFSAAGDRIKPADGALWITDSPEIAELIMEQELPLLVYLHPWNREASFPLAGFAMEKPQELDIQYLENVYRRFADIPWEILTTERCLVREMTLEDLPALEKIYEDGEVKRFMGGLYLPEHEGDLGHDTLGEGKERERKRIVENYIRQVYGFYGYGIWTVEDRLSGAVIGRAGFCPPTGEVPELGYVLGADWRRKGLAREVCSAILEYGKGILGFDRVQAVVQKDNIASAALCRRLGFQEAGETVEDGKVCTRFLKVL